MSSTTSPALPVKRQFTFGSWNPSTANPPLLIQCPDTGFVTRIDMQTIKYGADFPDAYPAGLRIYCSGPATTAAAGSPRPINWRSGNEANISTVQGVESADGIRDVIGSGNTYVQLFGYASVVAGHAGASLWQQQTKQEYAGCKLVGVEAIFVQWLDGARMHFACPSADARLPTPAAGGCPSTTTGAAAGGASSSESSASVSPLSPVPLLIGMAIGTLCSLVIGAVAWTMIRRRQQPTPDPKMASPLMPGNSPPPAPPQQQQQQQQQHQYQQQHQQQQQYPPSPASPAAQQHHQQGGMPYSPAGSLSTQPPVVYLAHGRQPPMVAAAAKKEGVTDSGQQQQPQQRQQGGSDDHILILP